VFVTNSLIQHNSASEGGVFLVENDSVLTIDNCTITNNFAIVGGVLKAQDNGIFVIKNSLIYSNYALSISIAQLFDVPSTASISGSEIYSNALISKSDILSYVQSSTKWGELCWLSDAYKAYLLDHTVLLDQTISNYPFQAIKSNMQIDGSSSITEQEYIIDAFVATVTFLNVNIYDWKIKGTAIQVTGGSLYFSGITMNNITSASSSNTLIQVSLDSYMHFDGDDLH
jgi:hypothetical protein